MIVLSRLVIAGLTWTVLSLGLFRLRGRSPLSPVVLAMILTGVTATLFPVLSSYVEPRTWRDLSGVGETEVLSVQFDYLAFAVGFVVALFSLGLRFGHARRAEDPDKVRQRDGMIAGGAVIVGLALYGVFVLKLGLGPLLNYHDYAEKHLLSSGLGPFRFGLKLAMAGCLWAEVSLLSRRVKNLFRLVGLAIAIWSIAFIYVRTNFLVLSLGYLYAFCLRRGVQLRRLRPSLIVVLLVAWFGMESFGHFRGAYKGDFLDAVHVLHAQKATTLSRITGTSELCQPFITSLEAAAHEAAGDLGGRSYLDAFGILVPRFVNPDRPLALSQYFVEHYYPMLADVGGGTAFSALAEARWNFGAVFGPLLLGLLIGCVLVWVEKRSMIFPHGMMARLTPFLLFLVLILQRSEFATLLKQFTSVAVPLLCLWCLAETFQSSSSTSLGRRHARLAGDLS